MAATNELKVDVAAQRFLYTTEGLAPKEKAKLQQEILDTIFAKGADVWQSHVFLVELAERLGLQGPAACGRGDHC